MSAWSERFKASPALSGPTDGRQFSDTGSGVPTGGVSPPTWSPTPSGAPQPPPPATDPNATVGTVNINLLDPIATVESDPISTIMNGLRQATIGSGDEGPAAEATRRASLLAQAGPLAALEGPLGLIADGLGGAGEVIGGAAAAVGGLVERLPSVTTASLLEEQYAAAVAEASKTANGQALLADTQAAIDREHGLFGTGILDDDLHMKNLFVRAWAKEAAYSDPTLNPGAFTAPGSLSDQVQLFIDVFESSPRIISKHWAQLDDLSPGKGTDRIDYITEVGDGDAAYAEDKGLLGTGLLAGDPTTGLNTTEQLVYEKMKSGDWTRDQAADFLANTGQAYDHGAIGNLLGEVLLDPINIATLGAAGAAKLGSTGSRIVKLAATTNATLVRVGKTYEAAEIAVKAARVGGVGAENLSTARKALKVAEADVLTAQRAVDAAKQYHSTGTGIKRLNVVARAAEGSEAVASMFKPFGRAYGALEGTSLGKASKVARTIIDPFHALDLSMPGSARMADIYSDSVMRNVADTLGVHHYKGILNETLRQDPTGGMTTRFTEAIGVAVANHARNGVIDMFRRNQIAGKLGEELMAKLPGDPDLFDAAVQSTKHRDLEKWLRLNTVKHVLQQQWSAVDHATLARQLSHAFNTLTEEEWVELLPKLSKEQKSFYKLAVYGEANKKLIKLTDGLSAEAVAKFSVHPSRIILVAKGTLTRIGGESLLTKLTAMKSTKQRARLIAEWQEKYQSLRYIAIDPKDLGRSVDRFIMTLEEDLPRLPMQLKNSELKALGKEGEDLRSVAGEYSLGFAPEDHFKWGLSRDNGTGLYSPSGPAWVDHVADSARAYRPANYLRTNIMGHPLPNLYGVRAVTKMVDHMDSAARIMKLQVSSAMVTETARARFAMLATEEFGDRGVTEVVANSWFERLTEYTRAHQGYSGPRGMGKGDLYDELLKGDLIPRAALSGDNALSPEDILYTVLRAYDGDIRYIGLTQKLSGRLKTMLSLGGTNNFAGQLAEHAWPTMKFRYNPLFQHQEKLEPIFLGIGRGVDVATSTTMNEGDRLTARLLDTMTSHSLVRYSDSIEAFEYSPAALWSSTTRRLSRTPGTQLNVLRRVGHALGDVQGMKRLNMLRTMRKGLGQELRKSWDEVRPGDYQRMKEAAEARFGRLLNDDDFALQMVSENAYANDIFVSKVMDNVGKFGPKVNFANTVKGAAYYIPTDMGELRSLDLDHMAESLRIVRADGSIVENLADLRQALVTEPGVMDKVEASLKQLGANPDYIRRTRNALNFSWNGFWGQAAQRFSLTGEESRALQRMMAEAAKLRDVTPVEFMSQIFSPSLIDGTEGVLGHIEGTVRLLREARAAGRRVKPLEAKFAETRTQLAGKEGTSTREDLVRQLARTFSAHLDPSAKRALLKEFHPELVKAVNDGDLKFDLGELDRMWNEVGDEALADRILGYMDGKAPSHPFDDLDVTSGSAFARDASTRYMRDMGVEPLGGRPHFRHDADMDAHYEEGAAHFRDLPDIEYEKTGRIPNAGGLKKAGPDLKPQPAGVDNATYRSYQSFMVDTSNQYDYMTRAKDKGGMGIKVTVTRTDPYTADAAGRAAMVKDLEAGRLKVFGGASDHPLMTNEQNVMFRAVHDVFGHAAEGFEFGPRGELNAAAKHARMFSNEGRPAMLTETHGHTSYVNYSDDIYQPTDTFVPKELDADYPADDFEARFPFAMPERQQAAYDAGSASPDPDVPFDDGNGKIQLSGTDYLGREQYMVYEYTRRVGQNIRDLPVEMQAAILQPLADLFDEFPGMRVHHIDVVDFEAPFNFANEGVDDIIGLGQTKHKDAIALTWGADDDESVILFNLRHYDQSADWAAKEASNQFTRSWSHFLQTDPATGLQTGMPRRSNVGTPHNAGTIDIAQVSRHEGFHAYDISRRPRNASNEQVARSAADEPYHEMMVRFESSAGRLDLSEYGMTNSQEFAAELGSFASNPELVVADIASDELREIVEEWQQFMRDSGEWVPKAASAPNPMAGKTIREVNAIKRGTVYAPQKAGLLPQPYINEFVDRFVGRSKHVESNPDVSRAARMFGKWSEAVVNNGLLRGEDSIFGPLLKEIGGLPTGGAVPYNFTEAQVANLAMSSIARKFDDAHRLQYFAQERTFLERSINHPMFGMYPASYMFGKVLPELALFLAARPFGHRTGGLLYSLLDVQASIALRREFDPEFDAHIEEMGRSQVLSLLSYFIPGLPWDLSAGAPPALRKLAEQGIANEKKAKTDPENLKNIGLLDPAVASLKKLSPLTSTGLPWAGRAGEEAFGTPTPKQELKDEQDHNRLVRASELKPTMQRVMQELQEALR